MFRLLVTCFLGKGLYITPPHRSGINKQINFKVVIEVGTWEGLFVLPSVYLSLVSFLPGQLQTHAVAPGDHGDM